MPRRNYCCVGLCPHPAIQDEWDRWETLPPPGVYLGTFLRLDGATELPSLFDWMARNGPHPVGLLVPKAPAVLLELLRSHHAFSVILPEEEAPGGVLLPGPASEIVRYSMLWRLSSALIVVLDLGPHDRKALNAFCAAAPTGAGIGTVAASAGLRRAEIRRWCRDRLYLKPTELLGVCRHALALHYRRLGLSRDTVAALCGWPSIAAYEEAVRRFKARPHCWTVASDSAELLGYVDAASTAARIVGYSARSVGCAAGHAE